MRNKRKNVVVWLYALCMMVVASWGILASSVVVEAAETETTANGTYTYAVLKDGTVDITRYTPAEGAGTAITIPDTLGGKTVTSIGNNAFEGYYSLESITIHLV